MKKNVSTVWNSWREKNLWTCLLQHGNPHHYNQHKSRLIFYHFPFHPLCCMLTSMRWNMWISMFEGQDFSRCFPAPWFAEQQRPLTARWEALLFSLLCPSSEMSPSSPEQL